jgi:hypothetical protein
MTCDAVAPWRLPRLCLCALAFSAGLAYAGAARGQALLEIDQAVWTDAIDRDKRNYTIPYNSPVALRKISLWMLVRGSPELLEQMKKNPDGRVRIRHVWKKYASESIRIDHDQTLDIGRKEDLRRLTYEVEHEGFFRWRTWSDKVRLTPGDWKVDIVWESDEPVMCKSADGAAAPCSYSLEVR